MQTTYVHKLVSLYALQLAGHVKKLVIVAQQIIETYLHLPCKKELSAPKILQNIQSTYTYIFLAIIWGIYFEVCSSKFLESSPIIFGASKYAWQIPYLAVSQQVVDHAKYGQVGYP